MSKRAWGLCEAPLEGCRCGSCTCDRASLQVSWTDEDGDEHKEYRCSEHEGETYHVVLCEKPVKNATCNKEQGHEGACDRLHVLWRR